MLADVDGIERIRFMTSHPKDLSDKLIEAFKNCDKLCKYIHLPVQAGSNAVLKSMNRHYTKEHYVELVRKLREAVPNIAISTDLIVGFPGESDEDFEHTLDLAKEIGFDSAFTFLYSVRKGTPAAKREDQVPEEVKHERFNRLIEVINESSMQKNAAYLDKTEMVLVDGISRGNANAYEGRTDSFKLVNFVGEEGLDGKIVPVKITGTNTFSLTGEAK
jgi:tRNA-2-methylthio-N6-dimethylallyladenosine synthase